MIKEHISNSPYFQGVYEAIEDAVRVPLMNVFSIEIPQGFEFEVNPQLPPNDYLLRAVQAGDESSLKNPQEASIGFEIDVDSKSIPTFFLNMTGKDYRELFDYATRQAAVFHTVENVVSRKDYLGAYAVFENFNRSAHFKCFIGTMCHLFQMDIYFNSSDISREGRITIVERLLKSVRIISVPEKLVASEESVFRNADKYRLTYNPSKRRQFEGWSIIVPDNFRTKDDPEHNAFMGIFNDGSADINDPEAMAYDASIGFTIYKPFDMKLPIADWTDYDVSRDFVYELIESNALVQSNSYKALFANEAPYLIFFQKSFPLNRNQQTNYSGMVYRAVLLIEEGIFSIAMALTLNPNRRSMFLRDYETLFLQFLETIEIHGKPVQAFSVGDQNYFDLSRVKTDAEASCPFYTRKSKDKEEVDLFNRQYREKGLIRVVNITGTDYQFIPLVDPDSWDNDNQKTGQQELFDRIDKIDVGRSSYVLNEMARDLATIFRVDDDVFNSKHDRECELNARLLSDSYLFCGLRSFAWTLAEYCSKNGMKITEANIELLQAIATFVEDWSWINFRRTPHFKGLCTGKDVHNYYVPDITLTKDKKLLLDTEDDYFAELFASTTPDLSPEVESLDALRDDLVTLAPLMLKIHDHLKEDRDTSQPLIGELADILYAWCGFAIAADRPFFLEDGPANYDHTRLTHQPSKHWTMEQEKAAPPLDETLDPEAAAWYNLYGSYLTRQPDIDFDSKSFVLTGVTRARLKDYRIIQELGSRGGLYRDNISSKTDYLVVAPNLQLDSRTPKAIQLIEEGKPIQVVLMADFLSALAKTTLRPKFVPPAYLPKKDPLYRGVTVFPRDFAKNSSFYEDLEYIGSSPDIVFPRNMREIGREMFRNNKILRSIVIEEGVESIGWSAFRGCTNLESVIFPRSLKEICGLSFSDCKTLHTVIFPVESVLRNLENYAFSRCENLECIELPAGLEIIGNSAFSDCYKLKQIVIPEGVRTIGDNTFYGCVDLEYLSFPNSLTEIGSEVFHYCKNLKYVTVPSSVTHIAKNGLRTDYSDPKIILFVTPGSYAERYAIENLFYYEYIS